jgi:hypothetical protein
MRYPLVLVYETDGLLAHVLRRADKVREGNWSLREPRRLESCLRLLRRGGPSVLVLKVGKDLVRELTILERVSWLFPDTAAVVVGDAADNALAGLVWDLGAAYALFPPLPRELLPGIVAGLMESASAAPEAGLSPGTLHAPEA